MASDSPCVINEFKVNGAYLNRSYGELYDLSGLIRGRFLGAGDIERMLPTGHRTAARLRPMDRAQRLFLACC
jgi:hypothetical protein